MPSVKERRAAQPVERGRDKAKRLAKEAEQARYKRTSRGIAKIAAQFESLGRHVRPIATDGRKSVQSGHAFKDAWRPKAKQTRLAK